MKKGQRTILFRNSLWIVALVSCLAAVAACKSGSTLTNAAEGNPAWLTQLIGELKSEKPSNPPAKIYRYSYNGQEVYYLTGRCCDVPSKLYDAKGNVLCEPDGGITGRGDGRCTDFFEQRQNEFLIWEDKRES